MMPAFAWIAVLTVIVACTAIDVPHAGALISPATLIDGPSGDIVELGGIAMASDGTGGIVYRKRVEGRTHIFAAQYVGGKWGAPQRVDIGENFESSFPAIGAGEGGRLVVVWVNHYSSTTDGLFSASTEPGSTGFLPPAPVDLDIGQAVGTYPSVAMDLAGQALVAYRVITAVSGPSTPEIPPGYVLGEIRMARFDGEYWASLGQPLNRDLAQPMLAATAANSPKVAISLTGEGLLVWQEPDNNFINRIWARRIFGMVPGNVLQVSPESYAAHQLSGPADEFSIDMAGFGAGAVAYRQQPSSGSGFTRPRVFVSEIPSSFDPKGQTFGAPRPVEGGSDGPSLPAGPLSVAVDAEGEFDVGYGTGDESLDARGASVSLSSPIRLDEGSSEIPGEPVLTRAENGALSAAWKVQEHGSGAVAVLERRADGTPNRSLLSAPGGGAVHQLNLSGSHHGDAIVGFLQGDGPNTQIAALAVRAPPGEFVMDAPSKWTSAKRIPLQWETPLAGAGSLTYGVLIDDDEVAEDITKPEYVLSAAQISSGVHTIQIEATDSLGQVVDSEPATLKIDHSPPEVTVKVHANAVSVHVSDSASGVNKSSVKVDFGDGHPAAGRTTIRRSYPRPGTYTIEVRAADKLANKTSIKRVVKVS